MQEINDLKNVVIQSLESHGVLSQLRAQIRSSVFKVFKIDSESIHSYLDYRRAGIQRWRKQRVLLGKSTLPKNSRVSRKFDRLRAYARIHGVL